MSYDLFFQAAKFVAGGEVPEPLDAQHVAAAESVIRRWAPGEADSFGCYVIETTDGALAEVFASDLSSGCMVAVRVGLTPQLVEFLFELLSAGSWVLLPTGEESVALGLAVDCVMNPPAEFPRLVVVDSRDALACAIVPGFTSSPK